MAKFLPTLFTKTSWSPLFETSIRRHPLIYCWYQTRPFQQQTMSALMNYIPTVQDFGKCGPKSRGGNQYGIPYISDCVGSDFRGPCLSSELPVPCGDRTCRSTFVECLAALMDEDSSKHSVPRMGVIAGAKALHVSLSKQ